MERFERTVAIVDRACWRQSNRPSIDAIVSVDLTSTIVVVMQIANTKTAQKKKMAMILQRSAGFWGGGLALVWRPGMGDRAKTSTETNLALAAYLYDGLYRS